MVTAQFTADDGRLFSTAAEAEAHDALLGSRDAYNQAKMAWIKEIAARCKTADGHSFAFTFSSYYLPEGGDWPYIKELSFRLRDCEIDDDDNIQIRVQKLGANSISPKYDIHCIEELYRDHSAAQAILFGLQVEALNRLVNEANETAKKIAFDGALVIRTVPDLPNLDTDPSPPHRRP